MFRFSKVALWLVACALAIILFSQPALAAISLQVTVSGAPVSNGEIKLVSTKTVTISVYDSAGEATSVLINNKQATSVVGKAYTWEYGFSLLPGRNDISVVAQSASGTASFNFSLMYVTTPVPGLTYEVPSLPPSGRIEAFNRAVTLSYPRDNLLVDGNGQLWGDAPGEDTKITFEIVSASSRPDNYHLLVSPGIPYLLKISVAQGVYLMQPGELTLPYDPQVSPAAADGLAIWFSPDQNFADTNNYILGGYVDISKHTVTAPFQFSGAGTGYYGVFLAQRSFGEFSDPALDVAWSYPCVMPLWAKGVAEPLPLDRTDGNFGLVNNVNRLEFATMLVKGLGLPLTKKPSSQAEQIFNDGLFNGKYFYQALPEDISSSYFGNYSTPSTPYRIYDAFHMPVQYAETAAKNGIIVGYSDGTFRPAQELTREEAAAILARVAGLKLLDDGERVKQELANTFEDANLISPWAASSVLAVYKTKLMVGKPGAGKLLKFDPQGKLTRAEALTLTYRLLKKLRKL
ncbi:S-layer homology domain-containing protein [Thermanaeromonas toyohensis ToBE]|uniref:S-layer homology domain-containing protein n=1 Tax=Thermanaeromonas toyohensis ToBE TaxID=698762 RepID=A0A1W1VKT7_9FIRM|nr:S-layer homology domain-containing protein [Thermanaeromonas toyohensis]SMB93893.1 S-layer homology domain-containing protein [Thermanaeromonas toyohensis ToBE]